ncbi:MAG: anhydro-N-acetylmuramic acid kinase [Candidatus Kapabacteria bacterium]|nr:anhydro-N-acetylmuramic acid kinase [Candidatus Kapabacteria bacterium]MDW8225109.1 anhydro-N-acetylmuramic acid kinase [Bacteroidota bacterium]
MALRLPVQWHNKSRRIAGVMSGTSGDGVDAAIADFWRTSSGDHFQLLHWCHMELPPAFRLRLQRLCEEPLSIGEMAAFHWEVAAITAESVRRACAEFGVAPEELDAVGMHGQTVFHDPEPMCYGGHGVGLQVGNIAAVAQWLGTTVVGDFRSADIALGGQGAPLVAIFDWAFLRSPGDTVVALNIGGIANVTVLPPKCPPEHVRAWDTGPGNLWIDAAVELFFGKRYDTAGQIARAGRLVLPLWRALQQIAFIRQPPPKTTGRELFSRQRLRQLLQEVVSPHVPAEDIVHTLTRFTAWSIAENLRLFAGECTRIIVSGGGARNDFLLELLQEEVPSAQVECSELYGIPAQAKEALCFAYLAYRTLGSEPANLPSVTGARRPAILGVVAFAGRASTTSSLAPAEEGTERTDHDG